VFLWRIDVQPSRTLPPTVPGILPTGPAEKLLLPLNNHGLAHVVSLAAEVDLWTTTPPKLARQLIQTNFIGRTFNLAQQMAVCRLIVGFAPGRMISTQNVNLYRQFKKWFMKAEVIQLSNLHIRPRVLVSRCNL
jgi:hypothetical protein